MHPSHVTQTLFENLSFRSERQKVISGNIANINTPNYKTKELVFESELKKANDDLALKVTHDKHIPFDLDDPKQTGPQMVEVKNLLEQNDGNNVSLDKQISEMSKNSVVFNALQSSIKKDSQWLKAIIDSSAKS
ncbi:MAG: flagellar basal body rod protein FlgB [Arcobacteraceae bacterium]